MVTDGIAGVRGFGQADTITGSNSGDAIYDGGGNDVLEGGAGANVLYGEAGADRFVFDTVLHSTPSTYDIVADFDPLSGDIIDVSGIDASAMVDGDQAFSLVGAFTGRGGEANLTYDAATNISLLSLDIDGDLVADLQVAINGYSGDGSQGFVL